MRTIRAIFVSGSLMLLGGCASHPAHSPDVQSAPPAGLIAQGARDEATAVSLVFDPPLTIGEPSLMLAREERQPGAFIGYQEQTITSFYIRVDDLQTGNRFRDRYERRAIIEQVGATYR